MSPARAALIWGALVLSLTIPMLVAVNSPLLSWREPVYITAGFAGVVALSMLMVQPLLAGGNLPGLPIRRGRRLHPWLGGALVIAVVIHVAGLWLTSPPDVIDALLFVSPTPFSAWGVVAMWALFAAGLLVALRKRLRIPPHIWRFGHTALALVVVVGSVVHAMLIEGTMGTVSKTALCTLAVLATMKVIVDLRSWTLLQRRKA